MGIPAFLITATLEAILAQRLVRKICPQCRETFVPPTETLMELGLRPEQVVGKRFYRGRGCVHCNSTGFKGRTGIFELLVMNDEIRDVINRGAGTEQIREVALEQGMRPLREAGLLKIFDGTTTCEEVIRETVLEVG
jgi:type IV pilus assembly protein PilB